MLSKIQMIAVAILLAVFVTAVLLAKGYREDTIALREEVTTLTRDLKACELAAQRVQASCMINDRIIAESSKSKSEMLNKAAEILAEVKDSAPESTGVEYVPTKPRVPVPTDSGDAKLQRLLDDAYCTAAPSDPYCSAR